MMGLLSKLAWSNLKNNRQLYFPFALATVVSSAIFYIFCALLSHPDLSKVYGGETIQTALSLGAVVVGLTVGLIIFYANSVVLKNRAQELGLYGILGLTKSNLVKMHAIESLIFAFFTVSLGLGLGILLDKLFYAILLKAMYMEVVLTSNFQLFTLLLTFSFLMMIFFFVWLVDSLRLIFWEALDFKREKRAGEKKGRFLPLQAILGLLFLIIGYVMALSVTDPVQALMSFFVAVLLVIGGTYFLFIAGTTVFLNWLKKRERFYYQPQNMIAISNLIYRLKKNAVGLGTITILSSMILVTIIGTGSMYFSKEKAIERFNPYDYGIEMFAQSEKTPTEIDQLVSTYFKSKQVPIKEIETISYKEGFATEFGQDKIKVLEDYSMAYQTEEVPKALLYFMRKSDYERLSGKSYSLGLNEVMVYDNQGRFSPTEKLFLDNQVYQVKDRLKEDVLKKHLPNILMAVLSRELTLVLSDDNPLFSEDRLSFSPKTYIGINTTLDDAKKATINLEADIKQSLGSQLLKAEDLDEHWFFKDTFSFKMLLYAMVGSLFFIGLLLSLVFILGAVLVIYYKQISEGLEDRENFAILKKLGLDESLIERTIGKQVLTVFFLPLIVAFIHFAFAFKMLRMILQILGAGQLDIILMVSGIMGLSFIVIYIFVYLMTSRSYKRLVVK